MRTTDRPLPQLNFLHPAWVLAFVVIAVLWVVIAGGADWRSPTWRGAARLAGYVAFLAMLVPYLHIIRRSFRPIRGQAMTTWLRWHIGAAYLAFAMVLIHSRGRSNGPVTMAILWLVWIVMISGVVGYYGQKLLYFLMPRILPREYGLERLDIEARRLLDQAKEIVAAKEMAGAAGIVTEFCQTAISECFDPPLRALPNWRRSPESTRSLLSENGRERVSNFADEKQKAKLDELWSLTRERRFMDLEYRLHQLGRVWLFVHGPAAWALLLLMVEHVVMSWYYGGW